MELIAILILIVISGVIYFLPSMIGRHKKNFTTILLVNIFLGWSLIGWVIALIMAVSKDDSRQPINFNSPPQNKQFQPPPHPVSDDRFDRIKKLKKLLDSGALTQAEFDTEKQKIMQG